MALSSLGLGLVLAAREHYAEAKSLYAASLEIQEKHFGPKAIEIAQTLDELATLLRKMKDPKEASAIEARAKSIRAELEYTVRVKPDRAR